MASSKKTRCANCFNAKFIKVRRSGNGEMLDKVRCAAGHWRTRIGNEKYFHFATIYNKTVQDCKDHESMGEGIEDFLVALPQGKEDYRLLQGLGGY